MRSFIALGMALVSGCGDNLSADDDRLDPQGDLTTDPVVPEMTTERVTPMVCTSRSWDSVTYDAKDAVVRALPTAHGAAVFMVPRAGGMLRGFQVDGRGLVMGDAEGQRIRTGAFTDLAATRVDGRTIVGAISGTRTSVMAIDQDLKEATELALVDGALQGTTTMMPLGAARVTATGGPSGMLLSSFDATWAPMGTEVVARSVPISMTSTAYGNDAMIAWSTPTECHVQRVGAGIESVQPFACANGRIAADPLSHAGWLVYEQGGSIMITRIAVDAPNQMSAERPLVRFGSSPRIAYDGLHYWISYLDARGDVVVGVLDAGGTLVGVALEGTQPLAQAHDLVIVDGQPWVFALDGSGIGATRLCIDPN